MNACASANPNRRSVGTVGYCSRCHKMPHALINEVHNAFNGVAGLIDQSTRSEPLP